MKSDIKDIIAAEVAKFKLTGNPTSTELIYDCVKFKISQFPFFNGIVSIDRNSSSFESRLSSQIVENEFNRLGFFVYRGWDE